MKSIQKLILPALFLVIILLIYIIYFSGKEGLGSFSDFDPNNNATKDIVVELVKERGVNSDAQGGSSIFYAKDKNGQVVMVQGPLPLPEGIENAASLILKGHLHKEFFHAHEVIIN